MDQADTDLRETLVRLVLADLRRNGAPVSPPAQAALRILATDPGTVPSRTTPSRTTAPGAARSPGVPSTRRLLRTRLVATTGAGIAALAAALVFLGTHGDSASPGSGPVVAVPASTTDPAIPGPSGTPAPPVGDASGAVPPPAVAPSPAPPPPGSGPRESRSPQVRPVPAAPSTPLPHRPPPPARRAPTQVPATAPATPPAAGTTTAPSAPGSSVPATPTAESPSPSEPSSSGKGRRTTLATRTAPHDGSGQHRTRPPSSPTPSTDGTAAGTVAPDR